MLRLGNKHRAFCSSLPRVCGSLLSARLGSSWQKAGQKAVKRGGRYSSSLLSNKLHHHSTITKDLALKPAASSILRPVPTRTTSSVLEQQQEPNKQALKNLFVASAVPMIGFGFMDNIVMIQAGQYIDSTLGVALGLATLTAAAAGT